MTSKDALEILNIAWSGRLDDKNYPNFDDINEALYTIKQDIERLEKLEKVIEILKRRNVCVYLLTPEEYKILKEYL